MSNQLPLNLEMAALPPNVSWTPQQLADAIAARMVITTQQTFALFVTGSTAPSSNVGPWLKNGSSWWVWSDSAGAYVPITLEPESMRYDIGSSAPDPADFDFWIETTAGGSPLALKIYYSGSWVDVYATTLASYLTIASAAALYQPLNANLTTLTTSTLGDIVYASATNTFSKLAGNTTTTRKFLRQTGTGAVSAAPAWDTLVAGDIPDISATYLTVASAAATYQTQAAMASYSTTAQMNTAISNAAKGYPAQATRTSQTIAVTAAGGSPTKITLDTEVFDPDSAFSTVNNRYVAPANGYYLVTANSQFDNSGAAAATMEIPLTLYKNGSDTGISDLDSTPSPNGSRWSPGFSTIIQLSTNDYLELYTDPEDGTGGGGANVTCTARMSVSKISS